MGRQREIKRRPTLRLGGGARDGRSARHRRTPQERGRRDQTSELGHRGALSAKRQSVNKGDFHIETRDRVAAVSLQRQRRDYLSPFLFLVESCFFLFFFEISESCLYMAA
jgi:hypothetical protein